MGIIISQNLINAYINAQIINGRMVKFMCGMLNPVDKFLSSTDSKIYT